MTLAALVLAAALAQTGGLPEGLEPLKGDWVGTLTYRDFQSDRQVVLPTTLVASPRDGLVQLDFSFDDGPGKTVTERMELSVDPAAKTLTLASEDSRDTYRIEPGSRLQPAGALDLSMTGRGTENDKPVEVREALTLTPSLMVLRRETRPAGGEFRLRHEYRLSLKMPGH